MERLVAANRPVVLRGALSNWPWVTSGADGLPRLAYLREKVGDVAVTYAEVPEQYGGRLAYGEGQTQDPSFAEIHSGLHAFCALLEQKLASASPRIVYLQSVSVPETMPALSDELVLPFLGGLQQRDGPRVWIGHGGQKTALHYDAYNNLACLVAGRKRFTLFPPDQLPNLYVGSLSRTPAGAPVSLVDPAHPDLERFPRFRAALERVQVIDLAAGDALFLPAYWFHHVESFDLNILVNFWWDDVSSREGAGAWMCFKNALLSVRGLPIHRREIMRCFFDHFVFQTRGDPYAHLPPAQQGWAGRLSRSEELALREEVASFSSALVLRATDADFAWQRPLVIAEGVGVTFRGGKLVVKHKYSGELQIPEPLFELLRRFSSPVTAEAVFVETADEQGEDMRQPFEGQIRRFMAEGLLVPAGGAP
jgi:hypothetical protein